MLYRDFYIGVGEYISKTYGITIDPTTKSLSHACYLTYDPDAYLVDDGSDITPFDPPPWQPPKKQEVGYANSTRTGQYRRNMTDAEKLDVIRERILETSTDITSDYDA